MAEPAANPLPVIDFSPFYTRDPTGLQTLIAQVRSACLDRGFFQLVNHAVPSSLQSAMFEQAQKFFSLPMEEKFKIDKDLNTYHRGYEPFRSQAFSRSSRPDLKEGVDFGVDYPLTHPYVINKRVACGPNLYPQGVEDPAAFRATVDTYFSTVMALAANVLSVIALTLGLPEDHFDDFKNDPLATVKMLRYPSQDPAAAEERGIGAHTDFGFVTLLLQDNVGGLQVFDHSAGSWLDVPPIPNAYVVNLGDCMRRATNDRYASGLHQVINKSGRERYSIAVFHAGQPDYVVRCLPGCADEGGEEGEGKGEKHEPVTVNDYVTIRYDDSYGKAKELLAAA